MTDEQIVKALEYCISTKSCEECPICNTDNCGFVLMQNAFDLIERQQDEIEELKEDKKRLEDDIWNAEINRGFAEQKMASAMSVNDVLEELKNTLVINNEGNTDFFDYVYTLETIENLKNGGVIFNVCAMDE